MLAAQNLKLTLVRERRDYHWIWDRESGQASTMSSASRMRKTRDINLDAGKVARIDLPVEWGGWPRRGAGSGHRLDPALPVHRRLSWNDDNRGGEARPDKVKLSLDKSSYKAGDTLKVTLTPPHSGSGVLIVESDSMLYTRNIEAKAGSTSRFLVTKDWERHDVYLSALVPRGSAVERITPARAVGEAFVPMDRSARKVEVKLDASKPIKPETELAVSVDVPALAGKQARVTISAVDVGILNITRFAVPDANAWFFAQRRLGVDAYDLYGRVIESFSGSNARLRFGGDMASTRCRRRAAPRPWCRRSTCSPARLVA